MDRKYLKYVLGLAAMCAAGLAFGAPPNIDNVVDNFKQAGTLVNAQLVKPALATAVAALTLQWVLTHFKDVFNGDLANSLAKSVGLISWFGVTVWAINHQEVLMNSFAQYLTLAAKVSGVPGDVFTPWAIIKELKAVLDATYSAVWASNGNSAYAIGENLVAAVVLGICWIIMIMAFFVMALSLFIAMCEFYLMFAVAPLAFGLIPLSAFRDQGMAPIKGFMSMGLRILILAVIVSVAKTLSDGIIASLNAGLAGTGSLLSQMIEYLAGVSACAVMAFSAGKLASSIASGSASFSGSDAMRGAMQMATTAGAVAAGVGGMAAGAAAMGNSAKSALGGVGAEGLAKAAGASGLNPMVPPAAAMPGQAGQGAGAGSGTAAKLGGSLDGGRPPLGGGADKAGSGDTGAGQAGSSPAGIGGTGSAPGEKSALGKFGEAAGRAAEAHGNADQSQVSVSMNLRGD